MYSSIKIMSNNTWYNPTLCLIVLAWFPIILCNHIIIVSSIIKIFFYDINVSKIKYYLKLFKYYTNFTMFYIDMIINWNDKFYNMFDFKLSNLKF